MASMIDKSIFSSGGKTLVGCSADGSRLFAVNKNGLTKILQLNKPEDEPDVLDSCQNPTSMLTVSNSRLIVGSLKGDVNLYSSQESESKLLLRCALPVRDVVLVHNGKTVAIGGDDLEVTLLSLTEESERVKTTLKLEDQVRKLAYNPQMSVLAISQVNGSIHFYSMTSTTPRHVHRLDNCIAAHFYNDDFQDSLLQSIDPAEAGDEDESATDPEYCDENRVCSRVEWHPHGLQFAVPCQDRSIKIYNLKDFTQIKSFTYSQIKREFVDIKYSPQNGSFIAAIDLDDRVTIWNAVTGEIHTTRDLKHKITNLSWALQSNNTLDLHFGTWSGNMVSIRNVAENVVQRPVLHEDAEKKQEKNNLFVSSDDEEGETTAHHNEAFVEGNGHENLNESQGLFTDDESNEPKKRALLNDEDDFIDDDDGAGYVVKKPTYSRSATHRSSPFNTESRASKFRYRPFSPGGTPFGSSDRRYLTMNNIGYAFTVKTSEGSASSRSTITTSFFDLGRFKEYHFEDLYGYDICSLTEEGALFAESKAGRLHYRAHNNFESWNRMVPLQISEKITSVAATSKKVVVGTSFGYVRTFNQFGIPLEIEKVSPVVALAAQDYKIFAVHFSPHHGITYTLFEQNPQTGSRYFQRESSLPIKLPVNYDEDEEFSETFSAFSPLGIKSLFFSAYGDPCIFGVDDVLLVLSRWRSAAQSRWVPLIDAKLELWKSSNGREAKDLHVWPLGLTFNVLNHILVKGHHEWPEFPMPLPSEMEVRVPLIIKDEVQISRDDENEQEMQIPAQMAAEEEFVRSKFMSELLTDTLEHEGEVYGNETQVLASLNAAYDKSLLRLFATACSEQDIGKALTLAQEIKQDKALNAAVKIAERAELMSLVKKVNDIREARYEQQLNTV
ncbi:LAME_0F09516g1_1 [Lachancea meyersii CBS 8951]|uniref:LAME_0F09516g1_1 n=1 Tax=Lachancea meyersii CBS 8951 TaxID=1266667 RepID=A0A1G4JVG7_9SACH|nr:LAME_0F09516g1_1 [Lachancea meyersii CBS 8951]